MSGVTIFQNKWIFHPGKVYKFGHFREEFPSFVIHTVCWILSIWPRNPFSSRETLLSLPFICRESFTFQRRNLFLTGNPIPGRNIFPWQKYPSLAGISFPGRNILPWQVYPSLPGIYFPGNEMLNLLLASEPFRGK